MAHRPVRFFAASVPLLRRVLLLATVATPTIAAQARPPAQPPVRVRHGGAAIEVENTLYLARLAAVGGLTVQRRTPVGLERALRTESVTLSGRRFSPGSLRIEDQSTYYVRLSATGVVEDVSVRQIWEFTRSGTIHTQLQLMPASRGSTAKSVVWQHDCDDPGKLRVQAETEDLWVRHSLGTLGGLQAAWPGVTSRSTPAPIANPAWRRSLTLPAMADGQRFLCNAVIDLVAAAHPDGLPVNDYPWSIGDFYPEHGLRSPDDPNFTFTNWNSYKYVMDTLLPVAVDGDRFREDTLIRMGIYLRDRLGLDGGWFKIPAWSGKFNYPHGDRGTANSRSFPALVYLWAHLTMDRVGKRWVHVAGDGDAFLDQLQQTFRFLDPRSSTSFSDIRTATGTPYIAYSLALRERTGSGLRGTINSHGHALHFAGLMQEASSMRGDFGNASRWHDVVSRHHQGSRELFAALYPATRDGRTYRGLINYAECQPETHPHIHYTSITCEGIPTGYQQNDQAEPEFVEFVERYCRQRTDPFRPEYRSIPHAGCVNRLCRVFPPALAFAASSEEPPRWFADSRWDTWYTHPGIKVLVGDFAGDARDDVLKFDVRTDGGEGQGGVWVGVSDGSAFRTSQFATWTTNRHTKVLAGNFDGLGNDDIMKFDVHVDGRQSTLGLWVGLADGSTFRNGGEWARWVTSSQTKVLAGDFDGDGKDDVMKADVLPNGSQASNGLWVGLSTGSSFQTGKWAQWLTSERTVLLGGDFNGDGKDDVMKADVLPNGSQASNGLWVGLSTGASFQSSKWADWTTSAETKFVTGDFNGDGKCDVMKIDVLPNGNQASNGVWVGLSTGAGFQTSRWADWVSSRHTKLLTGDFDADGRTDVMKFDVLPDGSNARNGLWVGLSEGSRLRTHDWGQWDTAATTKVLAGNFGGDSASDVMKFDTSTGAGFFGLWTGISTPYALHANSSTGRDLSVVGITEALGGSQPATEHRHAQYVVEGGDRKFIRTNTRFGSTWAPGFWEEKDQADVPPSRRFGLIAVPYPHRREGHYAAAMVREGSGDRVEIMCDYDVQSAALMLENGQCSYRVERRRFLNGQWDPPFTSASGNVGPGRKFIFIGAIAEKELVVVRLLNRPR